jgi:hypothetical protein
MRRFSDWTTRAIAAVQHVAGDPSPRRGDREHDRVGAAALTSAVSTVNWRTWRAARRRPPPIDAQTSVDTTFAPAIAARDRP